MEINSEFFKYKLDKYKNDLIKSQEYLQQTFVVFDLETTGLDYKINHITEIGAVKIKGGQVIERFQSFCKLPDGVSIPDNIVKLTGITDKMLETAPDLIDVLKSFYDFIGTSVLVGQNSNRFDMPWLIYNYAKIGIIFKSKSIDTMIVAKYQMPLKKSHSLKNLTGYYNLPYNPNEHHRADYDAELTSKLFYAELCYSDICETMDDPNYQDKQFLKNLISELYPTYLPDYIDIILDGIKSYHIKPLSELYTDCIKIRNN